jgi:thiol peroxidase
MSTITFKGNSINTIGTLPSIGKSAPNFNLVKTDLSLVSLMDFVNKKIILNIFPSIDTGVCAKAAMEFNKLASQMTDTVILAISMDLPFAHNRFCESNQLHNIIPLSAFRSPDFGKNYGLTIIEGPLTGLLARAVLVLDNEHNIVYHQLVPEITSEPDYQSVISAVKA